MASQSWLYCRFVYLRFCCCVFSERALKEAPSKNCHVCSRPFAAEDVVVINGDEEDVKKQMAILDERKKLAKLSKVSPVHHLHGNTGCQGVSRQPSLIE